MVKSVVKRVTTETVDDEGTRKTVVKEHPVKEHVRKPKKTPGQKKMTAKEREELLIENFVGLQHAMTNMAVKFGGLSDNISKLLQIFEESAKNFVSGGKPDDKEMLEKIDSLLSQNKTIASGLVLMEGKLRGRNDNVPPAPQRMENNFSRPSMPAPSQPQATTPNIPNMHKPLPSI